jgi:hypothetical protein
MIIIGAVLSRPGLMRVPDQYVEMTPEEVKPFLPELRPMGRSGKYLFEYAEFKSGSLL